MEKSLMSSKLQYFLIAIVIANLLLIGLQLLRYPPLLKIPGSLPFIIEAAILLIVYGLGILWFTKNTSSRSSIVLQEGTKIGFFCGGIEICHLLQETFIHFGGNIDGIINIGAMVGVFLLWAVPSFLVTRYTKSIRLGMLASIWSVIITILIAVFTGFVQEFYIHVPPPSEVATWPEFIRSGWKDIPAFTTANTLDSATTHLFIGPIVGIIFGGIGATLALFYKPKK